MWRDMRQYFSSNINNLVTHLILPNLGFTQNYKSLFNEEIDTFIGYYFRNTEMNSRRSSALELLQAMVRTYPEFGEFLQNQLQNFEPSNENVEGMCLLLTMVVESAPKGFRDTDGSTHLHFHESMISFCYNKFVKTTLTKLFTVSSENQGCPIEKKMNIIDIANYILSLS